MRTDRSTQRSESGNKHDAPSITIGEWAILRELNQIQRSDEVITLEPLAMDILDHLAQHPGKVISNDELVALCWEGRVVGDSSVYRLIAQLRKALGDSAINPRYIQTVRKRGYRLIAPVAAVTEPPAAGTSMERGSHIEATRAWRYPRIAAYGVTVVLVLAAAIGVIMNPNRVIEDTTAIAPGDEGLATVPASRQNGIAVLPFVNLTEDEDFTYFCDGISEELINALAQIDGLQVTGRTSSFVFRDGTGDIREIGRRLGASYVVEGSVRKSDRYIRVTAQLIDVRSGYHLWSSNFDREFDDVLALQSEIARQVVSNIQQVVPDTGVLLADNVTTDSLEAYDYYLLARHRMHMRTVASIENAIDLYRQAIEFDRNFSKAYAGLATALDLLAFYGQLDNAELWATASPAIKTALELDPNSEEAYVALARLHNRVGRMSDSEAAFKKAIELNNNYAAAYQSYAWFLVEAERNQEAAVIYAKALELEPLSPIINMGSGLNLMALGRFDVAEMRMRNALEFDPDSLNANYGMGVLLWTARGKTNAARHYFDRAMRIDPKSTYTMAMLTLMNLDVGDMEAADKWAKHAIEARSDGFFPLLALFATQLYVNDLENALETAVIMNDRFGNHFSRRFLRDNLLAKNDLDKALALYSHIQSAADSSQEFEVNRQNYEDVIDYALLLAESGDRPSAEHLLNATADYIEENVPRLGWQGYWLSDAEIHAILGNTDEAFAAIDDAIAAGWSLRWWWELKYNDNFRSIRDDPRFDRVFDYLARTSARQRDEYYQQTSQSQSGSDSDSNSIQVSLP